MLGRDIQDSRVNFRLCPGGLTPIAGTLGNRPDFSHSLGLLRRKMKRFNLTVHSLVKPRMPASVTGPWKSIPFLRCAVSTAGACFCPGSALGCRLMVFEEERAGPILDARGCPGFSPSTSCRHCGLTQSIVPAGTPLREGWCYPARKSWSASPFVSHLAAKSFFVRLNGVSPPRPTFPKAPRAVAVNTGRRPPP